MEIRTPADRDEFFDRLYEAQFPEMRRYAIAFLGDLDVAEEVVQDAFLEVLRNIDHLMTLEKPESWLKKTVKNKALHALRSRSREMRWLIQLEYQNLVELPGPNELERVEKEASVNMAEMKRQISEALTQKELFVLTHYLRKNTTYKKLSKATGLSISACQKHMQRIRGKLSKIFSKNS